MIFIFYQYNKSVENLILVSNSIGEQGAKAIAEALQMNETLLLLDLSQNPIEDSGGMEIASMLQVSGFSISDPLN